MNFVKKYKSFIGCALILFIHTGINSVATAVMPQLRVYYNCDLSTIIAGASACSLMMFVGGFVGAKFIRCVKPRGAFVVASLFAALYAFLIFITDKVWGFYVGCGAVGFTAAWGGHAVSIIYINKFHSNKAGTLISSLITIGSLGSAFFQFMSGRLLKSIGLKGVYLTCIVMAFVAILINFIFLDNIDAEERKDNSFKKNDNQIFKNPNFIKMMFVTLFAGTLCGVFSTLCTTFLQTHGMSTSTSTSYLSFYTLCCGLFAMISGVIVDKLGYRAYVLYLFSMYVLAIVSALLFDYFEVLLILPVMIVLFGLASPSGSAYNMLSKPIFKEDALVANTKLLSVGSLGGAILLPAYTKLYETFGFSVLWSVLLVVSILCCCLLLNILKNSDL